MKIDEKKIVKILLKINPKIKPYLNKKKISFIDNGLLDSLMVIKLISEIENTTKKKIKVSKINRNTFASIDNIIKFLK
jgi:acyl carrier protein